jgi:agmatinase
MGVRRGGRVRKTTAVAFPFDLFGSRGAGAGAELLADALRELLDDNARESVPTRARAYRGKLTVVEVAFETLAAYERWQQDGREAAGQVFGEDGILLWLAGNHLGVLPVYETLAEADLVIQLDAHLDVYNLSDCTTNLSHGNFLLHCATRPRIVNLGHRELLLTPEHVAGYYERTFPASEIAPDPDAALGHVAAACGSAGRVFLDIDCDVFDRAYFPATPGPVPFGLAPESALRVFDAIPTEKFAGLALSEFDPARDVNDHCLETLMWLIEYALLHVYEPAGGGPGREGGGAGMTLPEVPGATKALDSSRRRGTR